MKYPLFIAVFSLTALSTFGQGSFPGLKEVLSDAEWKRAGLNRLSADEIGVIDAALIRHHGLATKHYEAELNTVRANPAPTAGPERKHSLLERFGLPTFDGPDWRDQPPLHAKVTEWVSANRFKLDNGQIWEGFEAIPYELVGNNIEIRARPRGQFVLSVGGKSTTIRVMRLR